MKEALAGVIAFTGVLFIARPTALFPVHDPSMDDDEFMMTVIGGIVAPVPATPAERSLAVTCAVIGSFCAATAYATIRVIGKRVHSLVSVNYFAVLAMVTSFLILMVHPDLGFKTPQTPIQWFVAHGSICHPSAQLTRGRFLLASIGISGFLLQVLLTEGLQREKAGRATNLMVRNYLERVSVCYRYLQLTLPAT